jgi:hypothetical protein
MTKSSCALRLVPAFVLCLSLAGAHSAQATCTITGTNQTCTNNTTIVGAPGGNGIEDTATLTIINNGSISESAAGNTLYAHDINLTNNGSIIAVDGSTYAVWADGGGTANVINNGSILSESYAITGTNIVLSNNGLITGNQTLVGTNLNITNNGTVDGTYGAIYAASLTLTNFGSFTGSSSTSLQNTVQTDDGTIINHGLISAIATNAGGGNSATGIYTGAFVHTNNATIVNTGTILARADIANNAYGIYAFTPTEIVNSGTISALRGDNNTLGGAIFFQTGGGKLTLLPGSKIIGTVTFNGFVTNLNLRGGNHNLTVDSLAGATVSSTSPYVVSGNQVATVDTSSFAANNNVLSSLSRSLSVLTAGPNAGMPTVLTSGGSAIWLSGFGGHSTSDNDDSLNYNTNYYGSAVGIHHPVSEDLQVGGFIGAARSNSETALNINDTNRDIGFIGGYARKSYGKFFAKAALETGFSNNDSTRRLNNNIVPGGTESAQADYNSYFVSPEIGVGYMHTLSEGADGAFYLSPSVQVKYLYNRDSSYTEVGSTANVSMDSHSAQSLEERAELKLYHLTRIKDTDIKSNISGGVIGTQQIGSQQMNGQLLGQPISFTAPGEDNAWGRLASIGLEISHGNMSYFAGGQYVLVPDATRDISGKLGINVRF